jgi:hypothetical protein
MVKKGYKGRCEKRTLPKCKEVCRSYNPIQYALGDMLSKDKDIVEIRCNVMLDSLKEGEYSSDFVCKKKNGDLLVRECVSRKHLSKPMTIKLLEASRQYWLRHGVVDWGIAIEREVAANEQK